MGRKMLGTIVATALATTLIIAGTMEVNAGGNTARAVVRNASGTPIGTVTIGDEGGALLVRAVVHDLTPGFHGFHVHGIGSCVAPAFTSAGGHFNPGGGTHGAHAGDMPSLLVMADGTGSLRFTTDRFTIGDLTSGAGTAIVVHAAADNFGNVPVGGADNQYTANTADATTLTANTGNAGARIACGEID